MEFSYNSHRVVDDDGYFLRLLRILLLPGGIIVKPEYQKYRIPYVIGFLCLTSFGLCGIIAALFIPSASRVQIMETIYALNAGSNVVAIFIMQQLLRTKLLDLYDEIRKHYRVNRTFAKTADRHAIKMMEKKWILLCTYTCFSVPPLIIITTTNVSIDDMRALNFPMVSPWKINNIWKYLLTFGIEVMASTTAVIMLFAGSGIVFCYIFSIRSHGEIFKKDLDQCFRSNLSSSLVKKNFVAIIRKHQDLMKFIGKVVEISSYISQVNTLVFVVSCVMLTTIFLQAPNEYWFNLKLICGSTNISLVFFWSCYVGDELSDLTCEIEQKIYEIEWYSQGIEMKKLILQFMIQNKKQFRLKIFNMYWITLNFFLNVVSNCYSAIQLLRNA